MVQLLENYTWCVQSICVRLHPIQRNASEIYIIYAFNMDGLSWFFACIMYMWRISSLPTAAPLGREYGWLQARFLTSNPASQTLPCLCVSFVPVRGGLKEGISQIAVCGRTSFRLGPDKASLLSINTCQTKPSLTKQTKLGPFLKIVPSIQGWYYQPSLHHFLLGHTSSPNQIDHLGWDIFLMFLKMRLAWYSNCRICSLFVDCLRDSWHPQVATHTSAFKRVAQQMFSRPIFVHVGYLTRIKGRDKLGYLGQS